jgi:hypothetical protein
MPLTYQPVDIPLARGYDSRSDAKVMEPTRLTDLRNGVLDKPGAVRKREGYAQLTQDIVNSSSTTSTTTYGIFTHGKSVLQATPTRLYQYAAGAQSWVSRGIFFGGSVKDIVEVANTRTYMSSLPGSIKIPADTAVVSSYRVTAWYINEFSTQRGLWYQVTDTHNGTVILGPTKKTEVTASSSTATVRVFAMSTSKVLIVYPNVDDGTVECFTLDCSSLANLETSAAAAVTASSSTSYGATTPFDACYMGTEALATSIAFVHPVTGSSPQALRVGYFDDDGVFGNTGTVRAGAARVTSPVAIFANESGTAATVLFCADSSSRLAFSMIDASAAETANGNVNNSDVTYYACTGIWSGDSSWTALWQGNTNTATAAEAFELRTAVHDSSGTQTTSPATKRYNSFLVGGLFAAGSGSFYLACPNPAGAVGLDSDGSEYSILLVDLSDNKPIGCVARGTAFGARGSALIRPTGDEQGNAFVRFAACDNAGAIHVYEMGYSSETDFLYKTYHGSNVGGALYLGGVMTWEFDGSALYENGFLHTPGMNDTDLADASNAFIATSTTGALTQLQSYRYRVYYEYTDHLNRRVQSAFPYEFGVTLESSNDDVTLTIPTLQWTRREGSGVRIAVYRTAGTDLETFYRVDSVRNNPDAATVTVLDLISDAALLDNELDYQSAGELDNLPFPPTYAMAAAQDRLFGVSAEKPNRVIYSKPLDGDGSVEFNDALYIEFPETIVALATYGSAVYAFAEETVYMFSGEGPDGTGTQGSFSAPIVLARNLGVENPKAVCETPVGVLFVGDQGAWVAGADGVRPAGDVLSKEDSAAIPQRTIRAIHVLPDTHRVRIVASDLTGTQVIDWDYEFREWSRHVLANTSQFIGATVANGKYYIGVSDGKVLQFTSRTDTATFTDSGTAVNMLLKTAWIRPSGSAIANNRATHGYLLGKDMGHGHSVTVEVAYDYDETFTTVGTFAATGFPQIRFRLPRISFRAIMFRITEVADDSPGEGIELSALGLELAMEGTTGGRLLDT